MLRLVKEAINRIEEKKINQKWKQIYKSALIVLNSDFCSSINNNNYIQHNNNIPVNYVDNIHQQFINNNQNDEFNSNTSNGTNKFMNKQRQKTKATTSKYY